MFEELELTTEQSKDIAYEEIISHHFKDMGQLLQKRLQHDENPYLEIYTNANKDFDDGEGKDQMQDFLESDDSLDLGA